jgi:hypothetical protein
LDKQRYLLKNEGECFFYNGTSGVPWSRVSGRNNHFQSPWIFNLDTSNWKSSDNTNPENVNHYAEQIRSELEGQAFQK